MRVIWAYTNSDPDSEANLSYHEKRGTKSLYLQSPQFQLPALGPDVKSVELLARNVSHSLIQLHPTQGLWHLFISECLDA